MKWNYVNAGARNNKLHATLFVTVASTFFVSNIIPKRPRALSSVFRCVHYPNAMPYSLYTGVFPCHAAIWLFNDATLSHGFTFDVMTRLKIMRDITLNVKTNFSDRQTWETYNCLGIRQIKTLTAVRDLFKYSNAKGVQCDDKCLCSNNFVQM